MVVHGVLAMVHLCPVRMPSGSLVVCHDTQGRCYNMHDSMHGTLFGLPSGNF